MRNLRDFGIRRRGGFRCLHAEIFTFMRLGERMASTYTCRLIKSSWGIWISITARVDVLDAGADRWTASGLVRARFEGPADSLPDALKEEIQKGVALVEEQITLALDSVAAEIVVEDVSFNEADFQAEGLTVAIIRWAEQEFGMPEREILETFNKIDGRYEFDISD